MKKSILLIALTFASFALADGIKIIPSGSIASQKISKEHFTGDARLDMRVGKRDDISRTTFGTVTFEPGARTDWHTHPAGQMIIITQGVGYVQEWGKPRQTVKTGDMVWFAPNVKHWHGATENTAMSHIAVSEMIEGKTVSWLEKVSDEQFLGK